MYCFIPGNTPPDMPTRGRDLSGLCQALTECDDTFEKPLQCTCKIARLLPVKALSPKMMSSKSASKKVAKSLNAPTCSRISLR